MAGGPSDSDSAAAAPSSARLSVSLVIGLSPYYAFVCETVAYLGKSSNTQLYGIGRTLAVPWFVPACQRAPRRAMLPEAREHPRRGTTIRKRIGESYRKSGRPRCGHFGIAGAHRRAGAGAHGGRQRRRVRRRVSAPADRLRPSPSAGLRRALGRRTGCAGDLAV